MINKTNWNWVTKIAFFFFPDAFITKEKFDIYYNQKNKVLQEIDTSEMNFVTKIAFFFFPDAFIKF
jgi:hypothetical protein